MEIEMPEATGLTERDCRCAFGEACPCRTMGLSPRQRQTLHRLMVGDSEKEAARALGTSQHTLHVYVKQLYLEFGVSSRGELLARILAEVCAARTEQQPRVLPVRSSVWSHARSTRRATGGRE